MRLKKSGQLDAFFFFFFKSVVVFVPTGIPMSSFHQECTAKPLDDTVCWGPQESVQGM